MQIGPQNRQRKVLISLTPLVDIIFILLVFFMLASSFLDWRSVVLQTPAQSAQKPVKPIRTLRIHLQGPDRVTLDGRPLAPGRLSGEIGHIIASGERVGALVIVRDGVSLQRGIQVLQQVTDAGVIGARLAATKAGAQK